MEVLTKKRMTTITGRTIIELFNDPYQLLCMTSPPQIFSGTNSLWMELHFPITPSCLFFSRIQLSIFSHCPQHCKTCISSIIIHYQSIQSYLFQSMMKIPQTPLSPREASSMYLQWEIQCTKEHSYLNMVDRDGPAILKLYEDKYAKATTKTRMLS